MGRHGIRTALGDERGFTLLELLVVVTIIGILAGVVAVGVSGAATAAQTKANQATFAQVQSALDSYLANNPAKTISAIYAGPAGACADDATCAQATTWYGATGSSTTVTAGDKVIDFGKLNDPAGGGPYLRLNGSTTLTCVLGTTTTTLKACKP